MPESVFAALARDDSLSSGELRGTTGPLAKVPFSDVQMVNQSAGSGVTGAVRAEAQDGSTGYYSINTTAAGYPNSAGLETFVTCTGAGFRIRRGTGTNQPPIDMIVDGRCVEAHRNSRALRNGLVALTGYTDYEAAFEWPHVLKKALHTVGIVVGANPDGSTINAALLTGWLFPRADGFRDVAPVPRKGFQGAVTAITTSYASITAAHSDATRSLRFKNTDSSAHTVTLRREDGSTVYDVITIPIGAGVTAASVSYPLPQTMSLTGWAWKADANSFVTGWTEGA